MALGLLVGGLVALIAGFGGLVVETSLPEEGVVVAVPGGRTMDLSAGSTYTVYLEVPNDAPEGSVAPEVVVVSPAGDLEPLVAPDVDETYERTGGFSGRSVAAIVPATSGEYRITTSVPEGEEAIPGSRISIRDTTLETSSFVAVGLMALGLLALLSGAVVGIVWLVRRGRGRGVEVQVAG